MKLSSKLFEISWRLAILALPWQTRFFWDAQLAGWPWEQGRISFYISWLPILLAIFLGLLQIRTSLSLVFKRNLFWLVLALTGVTLVASPNPASAAIQWWIQVIMLLSFIIILRKTKVGYKKVFYWLILALIPHAIIGVWQNFSQFVFGSKWLGMAEQDPTSLGVSVVQNQTGRFLRSYGGFPHPNIFGGWMALASLLCIWIFSQKIFLNIREGLFYKRFGELFLIFLFTAGLFYSFSRSAWLAFVLGIVLLTSFSIKGLITKSDTAVSKQIFIWTLFASIIMFILSILHSDLVFTRVDAQKSRLESKSITTRIITLKNGVDVFQSRLWFGTGPNSELPVLSQLRHLSQSPAPLEPPHMVWLLVLVNFGIVGTLFLSGFGLYVARSVLERWSTLGGSEKSWLLIFLSLIFILVSLDHYLWSTWSGQVMFFMLFLPVIELLTVHDIE